MQGETALGGKNLMGAGHSASLYERLLRDEALFIILKIIF